MGSDMKGLCNWVEMEKYKKFICELTHIIQYSVCQI